MKNSLKAKLVGVSSAIGALVMGLSAHAQVTTIDPTTMVGAFSDAFDDLAAAAAPVLVTLVLAAVGIYGLFLAISYLKRLIPARAGK